MRGAEMFNSNPADWRALHGRYAGGSLPHYRVLVNSSVSEGVRARWEARGVSNAALLSSAGPTMAMPRLLNRNLLRSKFAFLGVGAVATGTTIGTGAIALTAEALSMMEATTGLIWTGSIAALTGAGTVWTGARYARDPKRLRRAERESARNAVWITPRSLRAPAAQGFVDTDEQRLFHLLVVLARRIVSTRAWTEESLQGHMSKLDLDHLVSGIGARLLELAELRRQLEEVRAPHSQRQLAVIEQRLQQAFDSAAARVVGLEGYLQRLHALDERLLKLRQLERSRDLGERVLDVLARTAEDEDADWRLQDLNLEAESHAEVIEKLLDELEESAEDLAFGQQSAGEQPAGNPGAADRARVAGAKGDAGVRGLNAGAAGEEEAARVESDAILKAIRDTRKQEQTPPEQA